MAEEIKTVEDFIESIHNVPASKGRFIFRGQLDKGWEVSPSLFRGHPTEGHILENALCKPLLEGIKMPFSYSFDPIEHLMNLQHFNVPTRLLDWTSDPLISLFFACYDENMEHSDKDGRVLLVDTEQFTPFMINDPKLNALKNVISEENQGLFSSRLGIKEVHIIEPIIKNPRMRVQDGCFMMFPFIMEKVGVLDNINLKDYKKIWDKRFIEKNDVNGKDEDELFIAHQIISSKDKLSILNELDVKHGINKETIFVEIDYIHESCQDYQQLYIEAVDKTKKFRGMFGN